MDGLGRGCWIEHVGLRTGVDVPISIGRSLAPLSCGAELWHSANLPTKPHTQAAPPGADGRFVELVREWWPEVARDLPWRASRDPWEVLVSEVMAQQTQVDRVIPKWKAFLKRFPTVETAAAATAGELIELWDGLGYNRRALNLHRCAETVVADYEGEFPETVAELMALPGIGPYTARAILAFAFEHDVAVVDTNVGRVLARLNARTLSANEAQGLADELVPTAAGWEWNQAILDFGAMVCTKRSPECSQCPARSVCKWSGEGADPAVGSAGVSSTQAVFAGSDRQARGELVRQLRSGPVLVVDVAEVFGFDDTERTNRVLRSLFRDGLVVEEDGRLTLP